MCLPTHPAPRPEQNHPREPYSRSHRNKLERSCVQYASRDRAHTQRGGSWGDPGPSNCLPRPSLAVTTPAKNRVLLMIPRPIKITKEAREEALKDSPTHCVSAFFFFPSTWTLGKPDTPQRKAPGKSGAPVIPGQSIIPKSSLYPIRLAYRQRFYLIVHFPPPSHH